MALRSNVEAATMALAVALLFKGFVVEAYKIPTGSMQPTLVGDERAGIHDRILVDKLSFALRDPSRWEVVVFRYPLDRSKAYVKRIVGVGPEEITIRHGDVYHRPDADGEWSVLRRPRSVQETAWRRVEPEEPAGPSWRVVTAGGGWTVAGHAIDARGDGRAEFLPPRGAIRDLYLDGYPTALRELVTPRPGRSGRNAVGDLRLDATVTARPGARRITLELFEGARRYRFRVPGPAAPPGSRPDVLAEDAATGEARAVQAEPWRLPAGEPVRLRAQNMDDLLELSVDGRWIAEIEVEPADDQTSAAFVGVEGEGALLEELAVHRDIYYTVDEAKSASWSVPAASYFMLGDNTLDSSDSRDWMLARLRVSPGPGDDGPGDDGEPRVLRGEGRPGGPHGPNPLTVFLGDGPLTLFRDEWGEPRWFPAEEVERLGPVHAPFVPRDMLLGRAVAVFWPLDPRRGIYRLGWVR